MASTITEITPLIDITFPIPGQDNDTQGFRNNFATIKNSLERAAEEISDLEIIQIGIANQLNNVTFPNNVVVSSVLASVVTASTINAVGNVTAGAFIGDGSQLTNIDIGNSFGTLNVGGELRAGNTFITGQLSATSIVSPGTVQAGQFIGDGSLLTNLPAPVISNITNFNITGTMTSENVNVTGVVTAGSFAGNGSQLTNVQLPSTTPRLRITQLAQIDNTATVRNLVARRASISESLFVSGNAIVTGTITSSFIGDGSQLTGVRVDVGTVYDVGTIASSEHTFDYSDGQFQTITIDTTNQNNTDFKITNWPAAGSYGYIKIQIKLIGTPPGPAPVISVTSATTYGQTSTIVDVFDRDGGGRLLGTLGMARGFGIYTASSITSSSIAITYIDEVVSPTRLSVIPPVNLVSGTDYHIAADPNSNLPYQLGIVEDTGQTIKPSLAAIGASFFIELFNTVECELYSIDGGTTIYFKNINLYDFDENSI
jgi:hypothetical protein